MSGGSLDYICWKIEEAACRVDDRELKAMLLDLAKVMHDCEWWLSCDISKEEYQKTLNDFKNKWFGKRDENLKSIINAAVATLREELLDMIGNPGSAGGTKDE